MKFIEESKLLGQATIKVWSVYRTSPVTLFPQPHFHQIPDITGTQLCWKNKQKLHVCSLQTQRISSIQEAKKTQVDIIPGNVDYILFPLRPHYASRMEVSVQ